jgi:hypothetical protein
MTSTVTPEAGAGPAAGPAVEPSHRNWWPDRAGYLAAAWAGLYGVLALIWTLTGDGYPFGTNDHPGNISLLKLVPVDVAAPIFAGVLLVTAVAALAMAGDHAVRLRGVGRGLLLAYGWLVAAALLLVVPDVEVLALAGYAPMLILSLPFGGLPVDYAEVFDWALLNKGIALVGGVLVARAVLAWQLRTAGLCVSCGRGAGATWTSAASAARWGRWAAYVAAMIPVVYAFTRFAWLLGIPLGLSADLDRDLHDSGAVWAGAGLASFATVGAVLTLGLVQRWGERFPRWMVGLAGRRVPIGLAVVPATFVAVAVAAASIGFFADSRFLELMVHLNAAAAPMLLWPLWAVALGAATLAYYLRRRGSCARCLRTE